MTLKNHLISAVVKSSIIALMSVLAACGGTRESSHTDNKEEIVWPPPPNPSKIRFIKSIHSEMDVGRKRSLAERISEIIFGRAPMLALKKPLAVHVDRRGRVLVVDSGWRKVLIFDFDQNRLEFLGHKGKGLLRNPLGVTTDDSGRIYVSDAGGSRILVYNSDGKFLTAFGGKDELVRPSGVAVNSKYGLVYVVDTGAHQVKIFFRKTGRLLLTIGKQAEKPDKIIEGTKDQMWNRGGEKAEFHFPTQIAIDRNDRLYVVDTFNFRVQILNLRGEFIQSIGQIGNLPGNFYRPKGIGLDSDGHIHVADAAFNNVQIFDKIGRLLLSFGSFGSGAADLRLPAGMFIDQKDNIYVADQMNHRIQVYQYLGGEPGKGNITTEKATK